eukprot:Tbor_TRINITY_DN5765_c3_g7::TRINITY_DN5765_c3_g7_i1::g.20166::m.20166/K09549/PFDN2; prefoldin subunit 2
MSTEAATTTSTTTPPKEEMTEQKIIEHYNHLRQEQGTLMTRISELDGESHEHLLVLDTLTPMEPNRRCHRLIGGVLVERSVETVIPEIKESLENINNVLGQFNEKLLAKEKEMDEFMVKYKINVKGAAGTGGNSNSKGDDTRGVLA